MATVCTGWDRREHHHTDPVCFTSPSLGNTDRYEDAAVAFPAGDKAPDLDTVHVELRGESHCRGSCRLCILRNSCLKT